MSDIAVMATEEPVEDKTQQSYFGTDETHRWYLPDGVSYFEHQTLNEGARKKYNDKVNREVAIDRRTGDARMKLQTSAEQHELIKQAVVGWNLLDRSGEVLPYSPNNLVNKVLVDFNPKIIDGLLVDIRKKNPWLMADMTSEDIQKQIDELQEMLEAKQKEEEGNAN